MMKAPGDVRMEKNNLPITCITPKYLFRFEMIMRIL